MTEPEKMEHHDALNVTTQDLDVFTQRNREWHQRLTMKVDQLSAQLADHEKQITPEVITWTNTVLFAAIYAFPHMDNTNEAPEPSVLLTLPGRMQLKHTGPFSGAVEGLGGNHVHPDGVLCLDTLPLYAPIDHHHERMNRSVLAHWPNIQDLLLNAQELDREQKDAERRLALNTYQKKWLDFLRDGTPYISEDKTLDLAAAIAQFMGQGGHDE